MRIAELLLLLGLLALLCWPFCIGLIELARWFVGVPLLIDWTASKVVVACVWGFVACAIFSSVGQ